MEELSEILDTLISIQNDPLTQKKIDKMVQLNQRKNELLVKYHLDFTKAYKEAGTNKQIKKVASLN